jgi:hypothetical protein
LKAFGAKESSKQGFASGTWIRIALVDLGRAARVRNGRSFTHQDADSKGKSKKAKGKRKDKKKSGLHQSSLMKTAPS